MNDYIKFLNHLILICASLITLNILQIPAYAQEKKLPNMPVWTKMDQLIDAEDIKVIEESKGIERHGSGYYPTPHYHRPHRESRYNWIHKCRTSPGNVIRGGMKDANPVFVCQAYYRDGIYPGKIVNGQCIISYSGEEISITSYRVLSGYELKWVKTSLGIIPSNAVIGGYENNHPVYVCRSNYLGVMQPGKIIGNRCNISFDGKEMSESDYEILISE